MKRTMNRLFARLVILCVAVILGAVAVSQAQRGLQQQNEATATQTAPPSVAMTQPIPPADLAPSDPYGQPVAPLQDTYAAEPAYVPEVPSHTDVQPYPEPPAPAYGAAPAGYGAEAPADLSAYQDLPAEPDYGAAYAAEAPTIAGPPVAEVQYVADALPPALPALPVNTQPELTPDLPPVLPPSTPAMPNLDSSFANNVGEPASANELPPIDSLPTNEPITTASEPPLTRQVGYPNDGFGNAGNGNDGYGNAGNGNDGYGNNADAFANQSTPSNTTNANIAPIGGFDTARSNNSYGGPSGSATLNMGGERVARSNQFSNRSMGMSGRDGLTNSTGNGKPGPAALEGPQSPTLVVTKNAPPEVQVGKVAKFEVTVRNVGAVDAKDVVIRDEVPHGAQLIETVPAAGKTASGSLMWEMGTVKAGGEVTVVMQIMPTAEGDIGSVATVSFQATASAKSVATRPQLTLEHTGPGQVLVGGDVIFHIKLSNPGSGVANNIVVTEDVPAGLRHADGRQLEYQIGSMRPGETRLLELTLKADQAGMVDNLLIAKADSNIRVEDHCAVEIIAPTLRIGIEGPRRRYLERRATFDIKVANPGTAPARGVELVANMPRGLKFVSTNNAGQYNSQNHTVRWSLAELPAGEMGVVQLTAIPEEVGSQRIRAETHAQMGLTDTADHDLAVEGLAAILFTVTDATDPIEVGGQTTYDIRIVNQGSKIGTNVQLAAQVPEGMTAINGEGPTRVSIQGQRLMFEPLPRLAPQADALYKIHVKGMTPGDKRIKVQLLSDELQQPVTKEESTHVYSDQ